MKRTTQFFAVLLTALTVIFTFTSCLGTAEDKITGNALWDSAMYLEDTEIGEGGKSFILEVRAGEDSVFLTVHTDCTTVGEALLKNGIIAGEKGPYGLYVENVNGIAADYDTDKSYWAFSVDGELAMYGVDAAEITEGCEYRLEYTK